MSREFESISVRDRTSGQMRLTWGIFPTGCDKINGSPQLEVTHRVRDASYEPHLPNELGTGVEQKRRVRLTALGLG